MHIHIHTSSYYQKAKRKIQCTLCPHMCILHEGKIGACGVRRNLGGKIRSVNYGMISSMAVDPIEKKPLYHYYPGQNVLSIGSWGCNLNCNFCQNWQISQNYTGENIEGSEITPEEICEKAIALENNIGVAYTYNEPTVWFEYMLDVAKLIKQNSLKNIMVSNGYINKKPLLELLNYIDAFNIDLKAFDKSFYKEMTGSELDVVLETIKTIAKSGKHLEITNLIIEGKNDNIDQFGEMIDWIASETSCDTVLHLSAYFPRYKQTIPRTSREKLLVLQNIANKKLNHVYLGNVDVESRTICSNCKTILIKRNRYLIQLQPALKNGICSKCNTPLY